MTSKTITWNLFTVCFLAENPPYQRARTAMGIMETLSKIELDLRRSVTSGICRDLHDKEVGEFRTEVLPYGQKSELLQQLHDGHRRFYLEVQMDNAAFDPNPNPELLRLLGEVKGNIATSRWTRTLLDINGNTVGGFQTIWTREKPAEPAPKQGATRRKPPSTRRKP